MSTGKDWKFCGRKRRVLILCTGNLCRSQIAEGFLRQKAGDLFEVHSAGSSPVGFVHPKAAQVMAEVGIDVSRHVSKHWNALRDLEIWTVITACGNANQAYPVFPGQVNRYHWIFEDPAKAREGGNNGGFSAGAGCDWVGLRCLGCWLSRGDEAFERRWFYARQLIRIAKGKWILAVFAGDWLSVWRAFFRFSFGFTKLTDFVRIADDGGVLAGKAPSGVWKTQFDRADGGMKHGDSVWVGSWPDGGDQTPQDFKGAGYGGGSFPHIKGRFMGRFALKRHGNGIQAGFVDGHVSRVSVKGLWALNWHRGNVPNYNVKIP